MKKHLITLSVASLIAASFSQSAFADLDADLSGLDAAYQQQERAHARAIAKRNAEIRAKKERDYAEKLADKRREQAYEDRLRDRNLKAIDQELNARDYSLVEKAKQEAKARDYSLVQNAQTQALMQQIELEKMKAQLAMMQAKNKRADDYIDAELANQKAHTDRVQAGADATRMNASGHKTLNEKLGEAAVKANSGLFK